MINIIVFSKDRPAQLDLLLNSFKVFVQSADYRIKVMYRYTNDEYKLGYDLVKSYHKWCNRIEYHEECADFKAQFLSLQDEQSTCTMHVEDDSFFCDNISFIGFEFDGFYLNNEVLCLSLRHGFNINKNYEVGNIGTPIIIKHEWEWRGQKSDWGYPMGYCHLYKTRDILPLYRSGDYDKAWNLECALVKNPIDKKYMSCYARPKMCNFPANITQEGFVNKAFNVSAKELNEKFLNGGRISIYEMVKQHDDTTIYQDMEFIWE